MRRNMFIAAGGGGGTAHRYWRILTTSPSFFQNWETFYTVSFFASNDATGVDLCLGKTASASTEFSATFSAAKANDGSESTRWANDRAIPAWWAVDMLTPTPIGSISISTFYLNVLYAASGHDLQFSDDGILWETQSSFTLLNIADSPQVFTDL